jgi:maltooligosyltrehalose trehalohydrolase
LEVLDSIRPRKLRLDRDPQGYAEIELPSLPEGTRYRYWLDGRARPDPASAFQPEGVHGPSATFDECFDWTDADFRPRPFRDWVLYELHVGTFSAEGTFAGVERQFDRLRALGVNAIELMPVAPFPGDRNWGYDGVGPYGVHVAYGGPRGLQRLVDAAHRAGFAMVLDVVYNHLGPEGNYLGEFGSYFAERHSTPWGDGINFDGPGSRPVRHFFLEAARRWFEAFHFDALRLDAVHGIADASSEHVLVEMRRTRKKGLLIAESDLGELKLVRPESEGGWALDAVWSDDFHHALHARLTGERQGYYQDFGSTEQVARALRQGCVFTGQHSVFREKVFGTPADGILPERFVVFSQNHDQIGNRARGERLAHLVSAERARVAAAVTLLAPQVPLLFMGEEYGERAPFLYFTGHGDPELARAVSEGRRHEFPAIAIEGGVPDPQARTTFEASKLDTTQGDSGPGARRLALYRELLGLRRAHPSLRCALPTVELEAAYRGEVIRLERRVSGERSVVLIAFDIGSAKEMVPIERGLECVLDTEWARFGGSMVDGVRGPLRPWSAQVFVGPA